MIEGKFLIRKDSAPNEYGEYKVVLQYCTQGVAVKKSTGVGVRPEHWLGGDGSKYVKGGRDGNPKSDILNKRLQNIKKEIDDILNELMVEQNETISVPLLRSVLNGTYKEMLEENGGKVGFVDFVLGYNKGRYEAGKVGYSIWMNVECYMNKFKKFLQEEMRLDLTPASTLYCRDISVDIIQKYIKWREKQKNTNDTINKSLTPIFKAVKECCKKSWVDRETADEICSLYRPTKAKNLDDTEENADHHLSIEQLHQLIKVVENAKYRRTKEIFDMFLFSFHAFSLRFSDVCTLRWSEIDMDKRSIKRHIKVKNHTRNAKQVPIMLNDGAMVILERWKGRNENFVFGMLGDEFDLTDCEELKDVLGSKNRSVNTSLQAVGHKIDLPFNLHFHVARHNKAHYYLLINRLRSIRLSTGNDLETSLVLRYA